MYKITAGIDGMMCGNCEKHMNGAVESAFDVKKVTSSHKDKQTVIITEEQISEEKLSAVADEAGYKLTSFACEPYEKKGIFGR